MSEPTSPDKIIHSIRDAVGFAVRQCLDELKFTASHDNAQKLSDIGLGDIGVKLLFNKLDKKFGLTPDGAFKEYKIKKDNNLSLDDVLDYIIVRAPIYSLTSALETRRVVSKNSGMCL